MTEWKEMLNRIKDWVVEAGKKQAQRFEQPMTLKAKTSAIDLVTDVDIWTERFLIDKIQTTYPNHAILTEESGHHAGDAEYEWVIDPIDGTTNFAHGFPLFCISVAVKRRNETVIGVVYLPKLDELYETIKGEGAFLNGRPIVVSDRNRLPEAVVATGFPYDRATDPDNNVDYFNGVVTKVGGIRRTGSAAIDLCQVAAGRFDGYWEFKLNPWDIEAGILMVNEAGGVTKRIKQRKGHFVLAGNDAIFQKLNTILESVKPIES